MDYQALEHMTVVQLRDEAKKHDIKGVAAMKKDELLVELAQKLGLEKPAATPKKKKKAAGEPLGKSALKEKIVGLKEQRDKARADGDKKKKATLRRRIHTLKRRMRKIA